MERIGVIVGLVLVIGVLPGLAGTVAAEPLVSPGPFVGTVEEDQTATHRFDNQPPGAGCVEVLVPYVVVLDYAPGTAQLSLSVGDDTAAGEAGAAVLHLERSPCTSFLIEVTGEDVADEAAYTVEVAWSLAPTPALP